MRRTLGAINGIAFVLLLIFFGIVVSELRSFLDEPSDNLHWNLTQLELDLVRFTSAVDVALAQPGADLAQVRERFDLFYSRTHTLMVGSMFTRQGLAEIVAPMIDRISLFIGEATPVIDGTDDGLRAALPDLASAGEALRLDLRGMEVDVIELYARIGDQRRARLVGLMTQAAFASGGMILLLSLLHFVLLRLHQQAEARSSDLQRLSSRLQATVSTSLDAVIVVDQEGRVLDYNSSSERILGYRRAEVLGQRIDALIIPPESGAAHNDGMRRFLATGQSRVIDAGRLQVKAMRKGGEGFIAELSIAASEGPDGRIFIAFLRDISQRIADEIALRTARDEALAAEQAKTNFLAVMSHEMRTPLNGVMAALDLLGQDLTDPHHRRLVGIAHSSAAILLRHVKDVLDISKLDTDHMALAQEDFDPVEAVSALVDMVRPTIEAKGNRIRFSCQSEIPRLRGDAFRLGQVVQNLLSNANKFTQNGLISVELDLADTRPGRVVLELRVSDSGIGIAEENLERIFQDFVMLDPSYGREAGGTGLGLAISRRIIEAMGGEIGVESELGAGSCFWFRLPLRLASAAAAPEIGRPPAKAVGAEGGALDLLVVEDNATNRILLEEMLIRLGHRVTLAEDGAEGVSRARPCV